MTRRPWLIFAAFLLTAGLGYWLAGTASGPDARAKGAGSKTAATRATAPWDGEETVAFKRGERLGGGRRDAEAAAIGAFEGQRVIVFQDRAAMEEFLRRNQGRVLILGSLDGLLALRVGFRDASDLSALLDGTEELSYIFPVETPLPGDGGVQAGAVPLGARLLEWLGLSGDLSASGQGVRIAVLDTGVAAHAAFSSTLFHLNLVELPADLSLQNGHGTAVASMILGNGSLTPGVAPAAEVVSIRIANDLGYSDTFLLAQGILAAVDAGVSIINISMGSFGDSALVRAAIERATEAGVVVVAAAGNNSLNQVSFPAAYPQVVAVGAVDAMGNHLGFSNTGNQIAMAAPGYAIHAAWPGDQAASVTGTSFSTPIVAGAIAHVMSSRQVSATQALALIQANLNDGGSAGVDPQLGAGMPALDRVAYAGTPGIVDAAVASQRLLPADKEISYPRVEVLVQNRGTETLLNTRVQVTTPSGTYQSNVTSLAPHAVQTISIPVSQSLIDAGAPAPFRAQVIAGGGADFNPSNDQRAESLLPASAPAAP
jgi:subtilisin family serine protease